MNTKLTAVDLVRGGVFVSLDEAVRFLDEGDELRAENERLKADADYRDKLIDVYGRVVEKHHDRLPTESICPICTAEPAPVWAHDRIGEPARTTAQGEDGE